MNKLIRLFKYMHSWYIQDRNRGRIVKKMRRQHEQLRKSSQLADLRARAHNRKQWVLTMEGGEMKILNRDEIKLYQRVGLIDKKLEGADFDRIALYVAQISNKTFIDKLDEKQRKILNKHEKKNILTKVADGIIEAGDDAKESLVAGKKNVSKWFGRKEK